MLSKSVLHIVMFKWNLNLKKNEDLKIWSQVFSNLHKQIYSQFNYMVVKTNKKPTFLPL